MSDQAAEQHDVPGSTLLQHDIPYELVNAFLDSQRQAELPERYTKEWFALQGRPGLRHYISVTSFEVAPEDPELRSRVTKSLLGLLDFLDVAKTNETIEDL